MALSCVRFPRLHRVVASGEVRCCMRALRHDSPGVVAGLGQCRSIYTSSELSAKSYLHKFTKGKKRLWYNTNWNLPASKPTALTALMQQQKTEKKGENLRIRVLNSVLFNALNGLLNTSEVSEEIYNYCIQLSKVSMSRDFLVCRAYWLSSHNKETDAEIEQVLQKYAPRFRHILTSQHVVGNVPHIVFLKDKEDIKRQEIEDLFAILESEEDTFSSVESDEAMELDTESLKEESAFQLPSIFGIDHTELNEQISAYKKKMKAKVDGADDNEESQLQIQQEQLAAIRKQKLQRIKMKTQKYSASDISPREYLLSVSNDLDGQELDFELQEDSVVFNEEEEEEDPYDGSTQK